jgi:hypothetical protein
MIATHDQTQAISRSSPPAPACKHPRTTSHAAAATTAACPDRTNMAVKAFTRRENPAMSARRPGLGKGYPAR